MVKGVRICLIAVFFYATIVNLPTSKGFENQIKKLIYNNNGLGSYSFEFETAGGIFRKEDGGVISNTKGLVVRGEYGYVDPDGRPHFVRYLADANGYRPQSDDIRYNDRKIV